MTTRLFKRAATLQETVALLTDEPGGWTLLAGGTDLLVKMKERPEWPDRILDLTALQELRSIQEKDGFLMIGALATHAEIERSSLVCNHAKALAEAVAVIGSPQIRNRGTLGGNIANASPAADTVPPLIALGAEVGLTSRKGLRWVPLESFAMAPGRTLLETAELISGVRIPIPHGERRVSAFARLGPRKALAISKVSVAVHAVANGDGTLNGVRVALGSVGPTVLRAMAAERALDGKQLSQEAIHSAAEAVKTDARPIDDIRSTAEYRREMCGVLLTRVLERVATSLS